MLDDKVQFLKENFGFDDFLSGQREIIEHLEAGRDVLAIMPTGSGKSLCYQLPALKSGGLTLVVSPLIALMKDQVDQLSAREYPATFVNSTLSFEEQKQRLFRVRSGQIRLLYVTPERFRSNAFVQSLTNVRLNLFAVDEAHCISSWGHDFRPDYLRLNEAILKLGRPTVLALTATATPLVRQDITKHLGLRDPAILVAGFDRPNLYLQVTQVEGDRVKMQAIAEMYHTTGGPGIVYAATRKNVDQIAQDLRRRRIPVLAYHAGLSSSDRHRIQDDFMSGKVPVIAATNAFGMGVDKADIRFVTHYNFPSSLEAYYQEIGRSGRDGKPAWCQLLFNYADRRLPDYFIEGNNPPRHLIRSVYRAIESQPAPISAQPEGLMSFVNEKNQFAIRSCLAILEKAGYIERFNTFDRVAQIALHPRLSGDSQDLFALLNDKPRSGPAQQVLDALVRMQGSQPNSNSFPVNLESLSRQTGVVPEAVEHALLQLQRQGFVYYTPPLRGQAIRLLRPGESDLKRVDFAAIEERRQFEQRNLERMIEYASPFRRHCLREYILRYFGEWKSSKSCGNCGSCNPKGFPAYAGRTVARKRQPRLKAEGVKTDRKTEAAPAPPSGAAQRERKTSPEQESDLIVALKIMSCVFRCQNQFGRERISQILRGSKAQQVRHMQHHRTYGLLSYMTGPQILDCIDQLVERRLIRLVGVKYPTLAVTDLGRLFLKSRPADFRFSAHS